MSKKNNPLVTNYENTLHKFRRVLRQTYRDFKDGKIPNVIKLGDREIAVSQAIADNLRGTGYKLSDHDKERVKQLHLAFVKHVWSM